MKIEQIIPAPADLYVKYGNEAGDTLVVKVMALALAHYINPDTGEAGLQSVQAMVISPMYNDYTLVLAEQYEGWGYRGMHNWTAAQVREAGYIE